MSINFINYRSLSTTLREFGLLVELATKQKGAFFVLESGELRVRTGQVSDCPLADAFVVKLMYERIKSSQLLSFSETEFRKDRFTIIKYFRDKELVERVAKTRNEIVSHLLNIILYLQKVYEEHAEFLEHPFAEVIDKEVCRSCPDVTFLSHATHYIFLHRQARTLILLRDQICMELEVILKRNPAIYPSGEKQCYLLKEEVLCQLDQKSRQLYSNLISEVERGNFLSDQVMSQYRDDIKHLEKAALTERHGGKKTALYTLDDFVNIQIWMDALKRNDQEIDRNSLEGKNPAFEGIKQKFSEDRFFVFCKFKVPYLVLATLNQRGVEGWAKRIKVCRAYNKDDEMGAQETLYELMFQTVQNFSKEEALKMLPAPIEYADLRSEKKMWIQFSKTCKGFEILAHIKKEAEKEVAEDKRNEQQLKKGSIPPKKKKKNRDLPPEAYEVHISDENAKPNVLNEWAPLSQSVLSAPAVSVTSLATPSKQIEPLSAPFMRSLRLGDWTHNLEDKLKSHHLKHPKISLQKLNFDHHPPIALDVIAGLYGHHFMFENNGKTSPAIVLSCLVLDSEVYVKESPMFMTYAFFLHQKGKMTLDNLVLYHRSLSTSAGVVKRVSDYHQSVEKVRVFGSQVSKVIFNRDLLNRAAEDGSYIESYNEEKQLVTIQYPAKGATFRIFLTDQSNKDWV